MEFKPQKVICLLKGDSFKYTCKNIHLDSSGHEVSNTYRFNKGVAYLVKNQEDYDELILLDDMFEAYGEEEIKIEVEKVEVKETKKEKKAREKAEKEAEALKDPQVEASKEAEESTEAPEEILETNKVTEAE